MQKDTFHTLCETLGDQSYDTADRWKSIKYITTEGAMEPIDFEFYYKNNLGYFMDNDSMGTGFLLLETPYAEFEPLNQPKRDKRKKILTFIGIEMINALGFRSESVEIANSIIDSATSVKEEVTNDGSQQVS